MISPDDSDYLQTKEVKQGERAMAPALLRLADWTAERYAVPTPLNILFERIEPDNRPRLQLVFERTRDESVFLNDMGIGYDEAKQHEVAQAFQASLGPEDRAHYDCRRMFVIFSAFEPVARWDANSRLNEGLPGRARLAGILKSLGNEMLWAIRPGFDNAVFFLWTDEQLRAVSGSAFARHCRQVYAAALDLFDEFGYFREAPVEIEFSSRETFERVYGGNWFNFDRR